MAKKVIQMYDKYKSTTKIYPKVIKECFQEDAQEYIEGQVVANPTLAGTESSLTGLEVGGTKYKVELPINVVANPTLAGTESELEGIQIGDTKYKMPSGGNSQLYEHNLYITVGSAPVGIFVVQLINQSSSKINTKADLLNAVAGKYDITSHTFLMANGMITISSVQYNVIGIGTYLTDSNLGLVYVKWENGTTKMVQVGHTETTWDIIDNVVTL